MPEDRQKNVDTVPTDWGDPYQLEYKGACPECGCDEVDHRNLWTCRCPASPSRLAPEPEGKR